MLGKVQLSFICKKFPPIFVNRVDVSVNQIIFLKRIGRNTDDRLIIVLRIGVISNRVFCKFPNFELIGLEQLIVWDRSGLWNTHLQAFTVHPIHKMLPVRSDARSQARHKSIPCSHRRDIIPDFHGHQQGSFQMRLEVGQRFFTGFDPTKAVMLQFVVYH